MNEKNMKGIRDEQITLKNQKSDEMYSLKYVTKYREVTAADICELEVMYETAACLVQVLGFSEDAVTAFRLRSEWKGQEKTDRKLRNYGFKLSWGNQPKAECIRLAL
ncbi:MAG: hypothetical protein Q4G07_03875 [Oscillospiraceae bacterium]|nr:hypothetical protein [Oscillospiraceae bacterium]